MCGVALVDPQGQLMQEIADPRMTRDDVAQTYALALLDMESVDWPAVNRAIIERWSPSALGYVKDRAWELVECAGVPDEKGER